MDNPNGIILLPVNTYFNPLSLKYDAQPWTRDFTPSKRAMFNKFTPRFTDYFLKMGLPKGNVRDMTLLFFEKQAVDGDCWYSCQAEHGLGYWGEKEYKEGYIVVFGKSTEETFYGFQQNECKAIITDLKDLPSKL